MQQEGDHSTNDNVSPYATKWYGQKKEYDIDEYGSTYDGTRGIPYLVLRQCAIECNLCTKPHAFQIGQHTYYELWSSNVLSLEHLQHEIAQHMST